MDAFDADVLVYAATSDHPLGPRIRALFRTDPADQSPVGIGSVVLFPELFSKPLRSQADHEVSALGRLLGQLELFAVDRATAELAASLGADHRLRAADAIHLATAVSHGAERFLTNNARDFDRSIDVIDITYPEDLPDPAA